MAESQLDVKWLGYQREQIPLKSFKQHPNRAKFENGELCIYLDRLDVNFFFFPFIEKFSRRPRDCNKGAVEQKGPTKFFIEGKVKK